MVGVTGRPGASAAPGLRAAVPPECNDDVDNDGDGSIDFDGGPDGEEPDFHCHSLDDDTENPVPADPDVHSRTLTFVGTEHEVREERRVLIVRGNLETDDGVNGCSSDVPTKLQRLVDGTWTKINRGRTHERDADGDGDYRFRLTVGDLEGRYRLVAPRTVDRASGDPCSRAQVTFRHQHRT
jgi:hypothetical protein